MKQIRTLLQRYGFLLAILLLLSIALIKVLTSNFPFWYDNARDLLSAWENLHKITLIGPTSGIPGIFYGPYWIWLLSIGLLLSKDPRAAALIVGIIPYCILFPFILYKFSKIYGRGLLTILYLMFSFDSGLLYATRIWNPYLAPVLFLLLTYLFVTSDFRSATRFQIFRITLAGFTAGILLMFQISLGIGVYLGSLIFIILHSILESKKVELLQTIRSLAIFVLGTGITCIPSLLFEYRHGFMQTKALFHTFTLFGGVVTLHGLSKIQILQYFFGNVGSLLHIPMLLGIPLFIGGTTYSIFLNRKDKLHMETLEKKLLIFLITTSFGILLIYLSARNPVWDYHFIGTEVIFLLAIGFLMKRSKVIRIAIFLWFVFILFIDLSDIHKELTFDPYKNNSLFTKEHVTDLIINNAVHQAYTVYTYSPSVYQYEYAYLFNWRAGKDVPYDPGSNPRMNTLVFLIIPSVSYEARQNFINFRTPNALYKTTRKWNMMDGTDILRRELLR